MSGAATKVIPQPKPHLLLGNAPDATSKATLIESLMYLAHEFGPIYRLQVPGKEMIVVSSQELVNELCDESRFDKQVHSVLIQQRDVSSDGLFTARTQEPNWGLAHRILTPGFSPASLRNMFPSMWDIAEQMLLKWERQGPDQRIDVADNMTRLTLDTLALCAMGYRFNSFYEKELHPYVKAMVRVLQGSGERARQPAFLTRLQVLKARQRAEDIRLMHHIASELIAERRRQPHPEAFKDLLGLMLTGKDPKTGQGLSDENIRNQMTTFLTAGHETTSGLLTFTLYELLANPHTLEKARAEAERVLGNQTPRFEHLTELTYIDQVLKETLRLWPTAPAFAVHPYAPETTIGGGYPVRSDQVILILTPMLHRDPGVWHDPERFDPDRMAPARFEKLPPNAWKPFGNGQRACIGRPFAMQEATLAVASILQRFDISLADPDYKFKIKQTLTIKPEGLFIKARRRDVRIAPPQETSTSVTAPRPVAAEKGLGLPLRVLFGSNSGSSEAFARRIANDAKAQGYVSSVDPLDSAVGHLPREGAVVIVAASYEGLPTDNARQFVAWLDGLTADALKGVQYAVFGCGNRDWARTYQAVPKRIDEKMKAAGAQRLVERGEADARGDFFGDFDRWYAPFWKKVGAALGQEVRQTAPTPQLELEFVESARDPLLRINSLQQGEVVENRELVDRTSPFARSKRHLEVALPAGMTYRAGDYLSVLPANPPENIGRAMRHFGMAYDAAVVLHPTPGLQTSFPTGRPILAGELLASFVELGQPATRQQIRELAVAATDPAQRKALEALGEGGDAYLKEVLAKRVSVLDLLERFPSCNLPFVAFLQLLPPLTPRQYSISSSPRWSTEHCTITVAVVQSPAWSGQGTYLGAASTYLAHARPGMKIAVSTRPSQGGFHPPESLSTPMIMVAAGTGLAPFRGFLQERAIRAAEEGSSAPALLFFGCDHPDVDFLYRDELKQWEQAGIVQVRPAFFKAPDGDVSFVQHRLWKDRADVQALLDQGARIYVCGDGKHMAPAVRETFGRIHQEHSGASADQVEAWLADLDRSFRYTQDVFA